MSVDSVSNESICSFLPTSQEARETTTEQIFVLSSDQLHQIVLNATKPLLDRIEALEERSGHRGAIIDKLDEKLDQGYGNLALEIALDRQRLTKLEQIEPKPPAQLQKDRTLILKSILAANNGKLLSREIRRLMRISNSRLSELLALMKDSIEIQPYHLDRRERVIILK